jgi:hypothetical protein
MGTKKRYNKLNPSKLWGCQTHLNQMIFTFKRFLICWIFILGVVIFSSLNIDAAKPFGANVSFVNSSTATPDSPIGLNAVAGNVTEVNVFGFTTTQSWQGYYGNVSGTITLSDSFDKTLYNWSLANPQGEIYASMNNSVIWTNVQCLNFTATGTYQNEDINRGSTSKYGINLTQLESMFNIEVDDVDGVNETFSLNTTNSAHDRFYTNSLEFSTGECPSTFLFDNTGTGVDNKFEEILLYDPNTRSVIFTSLLEDNVFGFDNRTHDFQMLVLENGHSGDIDTTPYYFYVELQ